MKKISEHISWAEATHSFTAKRLGIRNEPRSGKIIENMKAVAENVFEPLRRHFGVPIKINSFYRSPLLNRLIGGAPTSQHTKGQAIDLDDTYSERYGITNADFFRWLCANVEFDQLIWEYGTDKCPDWIHVSYRRDGNNRHEVLRARRINGRTIYERIKC